MGHWIELKPEGAGPIRGWRADPVGRPHGGIVVIQEIFGVNAHIRAVTDRFAADGYLAIAPAIFDHVEMGFDVGYDPESRERGVALVGKTDREQTMRDVGAAIDVAKEGGKVGIVGYCFGGSIAWAAACTLPGLSAAVGYYGGADSCDDGDEAARPDHAAFRREGSAHSDCGRARTRRPPSGRDGPPLSCRPRLQLRSAGEFRRPERRARVDADAGVLPQASGVRRERGYPDGLIGKRFQGSRPGGAGAILTL